MCKSFRSFSLKVFYRTLKAFNSRPVRSASHAVITICTTLSVTTISYYLLLSYDSQQLPIEMNFAAFFNWQLLVFFCLHELHSLMEWKIHNLTIGQPLYSSAVYNYSWSLKGIGQNFILCFTRKGQFSQAWWYYCHYYCLDRCESFAKREKGMKKGTR